MFDRNDLESAIMDAEGAAAVLSILKPSWKPAPSMAGSHFGWSRATT